MCSLRSVTRIVTPYISMLFLSYMRVTLKFFNVESLTNQREFYFAGRDGPRGSNPPKWNKMEQSIGHLSPFISFQHRTNSFKLIVKVLVNLVKKRWKWFESRRIRENRREIKNLWTLDEKFPTFVNSTFPLISHLVKRNENVSFKFREISTKQIQKFADKFPNFYQQKVGVKNATRWYQINL